MHFFLGSLRVKYGQDPLLSIKLENSILIGKPQVAVSFDYLVKGNCNLRFRPEFIY